MNRISLIIFFNDTATTEIYTRRSSAASDVYKRQHEYQAATIESNEFGTCYEYFDDKPPQKINCSYKIMDQTVFFGLVMTLIISGIISLIKGVKGDWDSKIKPEDVVGPGKEE